MHTQIEPGALYLVATPIGNLEDITYRAVRILREADLILAEDTRTSGVLLAHYQIGTPTTAYHEHNKRKRIPSLVDRLHRGQTLALISDAGTPGISDPGEELVEACCREQIPGYAVPGAVAAVCAITTSGLSSRRFAFEAFLPKKKKKRQQVISELARESRTIVLYEAPHHLVATLRELSSALGPRRITLGRELTKRFEEKWQTSFEEALAAFEEKEPRGEYVVVIEGRTEDTVQLTNSDKWNEITIEELMKIFLERGLERGEAMKAVAELKGVRKRDIYEALNKR